MFAAAITRTTPWYQHLAFNSFDLALVGLLAFGFWRGRKRGMSRECLPLLFWLGVVLAGGFGYAIVGDQFLNGSAIKTVYGKHFTNRTAVFVWSYLLIALVVYIVFAALSRAFKAKLEGSNAFGGSEYYLGIIAGILRYACILLAVLAGCWFALSAATRFVLQKRFPDFAIPITQKTGKTGLTLLAAITAVFVAILFLAPAAPIWLQMLLALRR